MVALYQLIPAPLASGVTPGRPGSRPHRRFPGVLAQSDRDVRNGVIEVLHDPVPDRASLEDKSSPMKQEEERATNRVDPEADPLVGEQVLDGKAFRQYLQGSVLNRSHEDATCFLSFPRETNETGLVELISPSWARRGAAGRPWSTALPRLARAASASLAEAGPGANTATVGALPDPTRMCE